MRLEVSPIRKTIFHVQRGNMSGQRPIPFVPSANILLLQTHTFNSLYLIGTGVGSCSET